MEHKANAAIIDCMKLAQEVVKELREDIGYKVGTDEVSRRMVRLHIRKAIGGDTKSMLNIIKLASEQSDHGVMEPCSVCAEIDNVMQEANNA